MMSKYEVQVWTRLGEGYYDWETIKMTNSFLGMVWSLLDARSRRTHAVRVTLR